MRTPLPLGMGDGPALVVLAAGMGSRFGGLKQLAAVGPSGETLMDYSVYDALRAGFGSAVFVIRPDMEETFLAFAEERYGGRLAYRTVHQRLEDVPSGFAAPARPKPWGTGQAVLAAEQAVRGPFSVINADDFYGAEAYQAVAAFLLETDPALEPPSFALVGYRVGDTLSPSGGVSRGVLALTGAGMLDGIEEVTDIRRGERGIEGRVRGEPRAVEDAARASMNMWGFTPAIFPILQAGFRRFLGSPDAGHGEFLLPVALRDAIAGGAARVRVIDAESRWFGVTYPSDVGPVSRALARLVNDGVYPSPLFG